MSQPPQFGFRRGDDRAVAAVGSERAHAREESLVIGPGHVVHAVEQRLARPGSAGVGAVDAGAGKRVAQDAADGFGDVAVGAGHQETGMAHAEPSVRVSTFQR